jgi:hypothetical protein
VQHVILRNARERGGDGEGAGRRLDSAAAIGGGDLGRLDLLTADSGEPSAAYESSEPWNGLAEISDGRRRNSPPVGARLTLRARAVMAWFSGGGWCGGGWVDQA